MAKSMQAVVAYGPGDYRLEGRPVPKPRPGEVVIRVKNTGICASDLKCYLGSTGAWGNAHHEGYVQPPVTPGHEFVGEVVALGEGAVFQYDLELGDHATSEQIVPCWECRFCKPLNASRGTTADQLGLTGLTLSHSEFHLGNSRIIRGSIGPKAPEIAFVAPSWLPEFCERELFLKPCTA